MTAQPKRTWTVEEYLDFERRSETKENYDRGKKSQYYRTIPSLQEYLLVSQDGQHIEHFIRHSEHQWLFSEIIDTDNVIHLSSIDCTLNMADVYHKVPPRAS
ncbi:Uma2 family endonuclease [Candidatus Chloroploca sp. Khr17]|uniref:Uma2 family endonuclease n=1 Tax=Candidatus Chloroploca sp. Khr17 TaxID=2496869 RepID=UPI00101D0488|nr:Uma2 family endonuclease [Candidatus Chloroploca sp. Khr17]